MIKTFTGVIVSLIARQKMVPLVIILAIQLLEAKFVRKDGKAAIVISVCIYFFCQLNNGSLLNILPLGCKPINPSLKGSRIMKMDITCWLTG